jgi:DNA-binding IscR family transcriptional regulator
MISKKCKYAIKALLYLADHQSDERSVFSSEIAEKENIPKKFLETILRELRNFRVNVAKQEAIDLLKTLMISIYQN